MSKKLKILTHPNEILRKISTDINLEDINKAELQDFIANMEKTMIEANGAGLAAPQVGKNIRLIMIHAKPKNIIMINPVITKKSWAKVIEEEGCLSVVDKNGKLYFRDVARHKRVKCSYLDIKGKNRKIEAEGLLSKAIQHEIDHLDGILFIDKIEK